MQPQDADGPQPGTETPGQDPSSGARTGTPAEPFRPGWEGTGRLVCRPRMGTRCPCPVTEAHRPSQQRPSMAPYAPFPSRHGRVPATQAPDLPCLGPQSGGEARQRGAALQPWIHPAPMHSCHTCSGARGSESIGSSPFFPTLLIKPTRNRSVYFRPEAIMTVQQSEGVGCTG